MNKLEKFKKFALTSEQVKNVKGGGDWRCYFSSAASGYQPILMEGGNTLWFGDTGSPESATNLCNMNAYCVGCEPL
jgi:hypothetical protein